MVPASGSFEHHAAPENLKASTAVHSRLLRKKLTRLRDASSLFRHVPDLAYIGFTPSAIKPQPPPPPTHPSNVVTYMHCA